MVRLFWIIRKIVVFETHLGSVSPLWYRSILPFKEERVGSRFIAKVLGRNLSNAKDRIRKVLRSHSLDDSS